MPRLCAFLSVVALVLPLPAVAQVGPPRPPGPYVIDLRGLTSGMPSSAGFYPLVTENVNVPARGFGGEGGAHIYLLNLGRSRLGLGASYTIVRAAADGVTSDVRLLAPQISFNFGSANGWSYLSAGLGMSRVRTEIGTLTPAESGSVRTINVGGGARWFLTSHLGVSFDVRFYRLGTGEPRGARAGTPPTTVVATALGLSIK